jgi:hypothetical protein
METGNFLFEVYVAYIVVAVGLTVWLARTLFNNGAIFLDDVFQGNPKLSESVNRLLVVGFFMLNLGYAFKTMKAYEAATPFAAVEVFAAKIGTLLVTLGAIHFLNLFVFHKIRAKKREAILPPPVEPNALIPQV